MQLNRRDLLTSGTGGVVGGLLNAGQTTAAEGTSVTRNVYQELGIRPIINAAGTITTLGGSLMPPEVTDAWAAASRGFVDLLELQDRVGERIAELLGVEAALVTTGAAGGIVLATAAALTVKDRSRVSQLPLASDKKIEVIRQTTHRECYDHQVTACGVQLVDVTSAEELEQAINDRTAMMFSYNVHEDVSSIAASDWIAIARKHGVPTLLDAAADTPPLEALWKYNHKGYDMVVFSGGKAMRGPQDAGLLLGRKDLIEAAKLNTSPNCGNIGRGMKVSKEDMVAMWAAIDRYFRLDHDAEIKEWERRISVIEDLVSSVPTVTTKRIVPPIANHVPHLLVFWDESVIPLTPGRLKQELRAGDPAIATARVHGTGEEGFLISVFMLQPGEEEVVGHRIRDTLHAFRDTGN